MKKLLIASALGMSFLFGGVSASAVYPGSQNGGGLTPAQQQAKQDRVKWLKLQGIELVPTSDSESGAFDDRWQDQMRNQTQGSPILLQPSFDRGAAYNPQQNTMPSMPENPGNSLWKTKLTDNDFNDLLAISYKYFSDDLKSSESQ